MTGDRWGFYSDLSVWCWLEHDRLAELNQMGWTLVKRYIEHRFPIHYKLHKAEYLFQQKQDLLAAKLKNGKQSLNAVNLTKNRNKANQLGLTVSKYKVVYIQTLSHLKGNKKILFFLFHDPSHHII